MMAQDRERSPLPLPISPDRLASVRDASLTHAERELYRWVLLRFAAGEGVMGADYVAAGERLGLSPEQATDRLEEVDLVVRDAVSRNVRCAYPFSGVPTPHRVRLVEQDESLYAMCAVDALGIPFML